jgi:hypothetical protein
MSDYYRFQANPIPRNNTYAMVKFKKGLYSVLLEDFNTRRKILLKSGIRNNQAELNPGYPIMAWDPKGSRLLVIYPEQGKIRMFVYDVIKKMKFNKQEIKDFQLIQDAKFMLDNNTLVMSASRNGQSDLYVYKINEQTYQQITNDPYSDIDPSFVAFPNKSGIIFSSDRPGGDASKADTVNPSRNLFNIYLVDNWNRSEYKQITKLSNLKYSDARFPLQYNINHFTFVSSENGIGNRYAGFFTTKRAGLDTLYLVGDEILRNPVQAELDSTLQAWEKKEPDSIGYISITTDSAYVFPITNYQSSLQESRGAGDNNQISEVRREGDLKFLYKLKINEDALRRRNINARPTEYIKKLIEQERVAKGETVFYDKAGKQQEVFTTDTTKEKAIFQSEFENETKDSLGLPILEPTAPPKESPIKNAKIYDYRRQFSSEYIVSGFNNSVW